MFVTLPFIALDKRSFAYVVNVSPAPVELLSWASWRELYFLFESVDEMTKSVIAPMLVIVLALPSVVWHPAPKAGEFAPTSKLIILNS